MKLKAKNSGTRNYIFPLIYVPTAKATLSNLPLLTNENTQESIGPIPVAMQKWRERFTGYVRRTQTIPSSMNLNWRSS